MCAMSPPKADLCPHLDSGHMNTCTPTNPECWTSRTFCSYADNPNNCSVYRRLQKGSDPTKEIVPAPFEHCRIKVIIRT